MAAAPLTPHLLENESFYENALCWLGRPQEAYRLLSEAVFPSVSSWVRGEVDSHSFNHWQPEDVRTFLYPVVALGEHETLVLSSEALLLCGIGNYYNPCDLAIVVFVQQPQELFSQLMQRIRRAEAIISRGPDVRMLSEQVNLAKRGRDYINTKYLVWPYALSGAAQDTLIKQGISIIRLSPQEAALPFAD
ncbi:hypothetical protein [Thermostichus vulcanus]|uniref:Uncharacterized protein n=1 Tax=Thermostichus vulcanus str. 'Rupite' TaxID=2813851 RepID=A0ABT0CCL9_THEVL|nr:hypothetical protein [Thermostichus vulcanus]MCJ2543532.1 hypothetical protein [Thermostichus vulcanus str. 'Rupite']